MPIYKVDVKTVWIESYYIEAETPEDATSIAMDDETGMYHGEMIESNHHATSVAKTLPDNYGVYDETA